MNDTLKAVGNIGAELGAAKAENEAMRILLRESYSELLVMKTEVGFRGKTLDLIDRIDAFLSTQAEPTDAFTATDMINQSAQAFRDGQAAVEPAPAQDEKAAFEAAYHVVVDNGWTNVKHMARQVWDQARATRPAQAEQQPVCWASSTALAKLRNGRNNSPCVLTDGPAEFNDTPLYAIAQTAPQPEQSEEIAWDTLKAATDILERRAAPHAWISLAWEAGSKVITSRRAALSAQGAKP